MASMEKMQDRVNCRSFVVNGTRPVKISVTVTHALKIISTENLLAVKMVFLWNTVTFSNCM